MGTLVKAHRWATAALGVGCSVLLATALGDHAVSALRQPLPLVWPLAVLQVAFALVPLGNPFAELAGGAVRARRVRAVNLGATTTLVAVAVTVDHASYDSVAFATWFVLLAGCGVVAATVWGQQALGAVLGLGLVTVGLEFMTGWAPVTRIAAVVSPPLAVVFCAVCAGGFVVVTARRG
jgi:hypothetical protein